MLTHGRHVRFWRKDKQTFTLNNLPVASHKQEHKRFQQNHVQATFGVGQQSTERTEECWKTWAKKTKSFEGIISKRNYVRDWINYQENESKLLSEISLRAWAIVI